MPVNQEMLKTAQRLTVKSAAFHRTTHDLGKFLFTGGPSSSGHEQPGLGYSGAGLLGGSLGSLIGAYRAEKGKKLRGALRGGLIGVGAGLGARGAGGAAFRGLYDTVLNNQYPAALAALAGGGLAGAGSAGLFDGVEEVANENSKDKEEEGRKTAAGGPSSLTQGSENIMHDLAFQFGEKVGFFGQMNPAGLSKVLQHPAALGGLGGATAGAVSGLIAPGEYEDADGNMKRRSRLGSALRRALMLGAGGAGAGMAYDYFSGSKSPKLPAPHDRDAAAAKNPFLTSQQPKMEQTMERRFSGQADQRGAVNDQLDKPNPFLDLRHDVQNIEIPKRKSSEPTAGPDRGVRV